MAFKTEEKSVNVRKRYDPYDEQDRKIILNFERMIIPYGYDFEKYTKGSGLTVHYGRYALLGAVNGGMPQVYSEMLMRHHGLGTLRWMREDAKRNNVFLDQSYFLNNNPNNKLIVDEKPYAQEN